MMRKFTILLALVVALAACRSVPLDIRQAHDTSLRNHTVAVAVIKNLTSKPVADLTAEEVRSAQEVFEAQWVQLFENRTKVANWLFIEKAKDAAQGYAAGQAIYSDMNRHYLVMFLKWQQYDTPEAKLHIRLWLDDAARAAELNRKFDEWIRQFRVKGA